MGSSIENPAKGRGENQAGIVTLAKTTFSNRARAIENLNCSSSISSPNRPENRVARVPITPD